MQPGLALPQVQMPPDPLLDAVVHRGLRFAFGAGKARIAAKVDMHVHGFAGGVDVDAGLGKFEQRLEGGSVGHASSVT